MPVVKSKHLLQRAMLLRIHLLVIFSLLSAKNQLKQFKPNNKSSRTGVGDHEIKDLLSKEIQFKTLDN